MRLPRPRFTVRRLMVAMALLGFILAAVAEALRLSRLGADYRRRATLHGEDMNADFRGHLTCLFHTQLTVVGRALFPCLDGF
jgi:hypothetical protein